MAEGEKYEIVAGVPSENNGARMYVSINKGKAEVHFIAPLDLNYALHLTALIAATEAKTRGTDTGEHK